MLGSFRLACCVQNGSSHVMCHDWALANGKPRQLDWIYHLGTFVENHARNKTRTDEENFGKVESENLKHPLMKYLINNAPKTPSTSTRPMKFLSIRSKNTSRKTPPTSQTFVSFRRDSRSTIIQGCTGRLQTPQKPHQTRTRLRLRRKKRSSWVGKLRSVRFAALELSGRAALPFSRTALLPNGTTNLKIHHLGSVPDWRPMSARKNYLLPILLAKPLHNI